MKRLPLTEASTYGHPEFHRKISEVSDVLLLFTFKRRQKVISTVFYKTTDDDATFGMNLAIEPRLIRS